jgi:hypothetical protein
VAFFISLVLLISQSSPTLPAATNVERDPQAVTLLQSAVSVMAPGGLPSDSTATGTVAIVAGSQNSSGTISILTRGSAQSSVQFQTSLSAWSVTYSNQQASRTVGTTATPLCLEEASTSLSVYFPLPVLAGLLSNPDVALVYIGQETLGFSQVQHIQATNTFQSNASLQFLAPFTVTDIWLDATTGLPTKISYIRRKGGGSAPKIPFSVVYSNYQTVSGVSYPFTIQEYATETLWATTTIQTVVLNSGLTDSNFPVATGGN